MILYIVFPVASLTLPLHPIGRLGCGNYVNCPPNALDNGLKSVAQQVGVHVLKLTLTIDGSPDFSDYQIHF